MNKIWKNEKQKYNSVMSCYVGQIRVGFVVWNSLKSKNDVGVDYIYNCLLPGFDVKSGSIATQADGMATVETMVDEWFKKIGQD